MSSLIIMQTSLSATPTAVEAIPSSSNYNDENDDDGDYSDDDGDYLSSQSYFTHSANPTTTTLIPYITALSTTLSTPTSNNLGTTTKALTSSTILTLSISTPTNSQTGRSTQTKPSHSAVAALETKAINSDSATKAGLALASILGVLALFTVLYFLFGFLPKRKQQQQHQHQYKHDNNSLEKGIIKLNLSPASLGRQEKGVVYDHDTTRPHLSFLRRKWYSNGSLASKVPSSIANTSTPRSSTVLLTPPSCRSAHGLGLGRVTSLFTRRVRQQSRFSDSTTSSATSVRFSKVPAAHTSSPARSERDTSSGRGYRLAYAAHNYQGNRPSRDLSEEGFGLERTLVRRDSGNTMETEKDKRREASLRSSVSVTETLDTRSNGKRIALPRLPLPVFSPTRLEM